MYLKTLRLKNFRNFSEMSLSVHPRFNIFVGPNAQGKTNILEAIYLLAFGRSFRVSDYAELIHWKELAAFVRAWLTTPVGDEERSAELNAEKKTFLKDGKKTTPNQFQSMPLVLFAPEVILLLKDSPQARRDYIDGVLSKISPTYGDRLRKYEKSLMQRNKLLKDENISIEEKRSQITLWEPSLVEEGSYLIKERRNGLARLSQLIEKHYNIIAGSSEKRGHFFYQPNVEPPNFSKKFEERREEELERLSTLVGPHRDEITPHLNDGAIRSFGSQGELRSFTLGMKLAEIDLFEESLGRSPILLLDDVLSELDEKRSRLFFEYLQNFGGQVFATTTALSLFPSKSIKDFSTFAVEKGQLSALLL